MDTTLATLLTTLAVDAVLDRRISPDDCAQVFLDAGHPVPIVLDDEVFGTAVPTGLLLLIPALRTSGVDRLRISLVHPSLAHSVPRVPRETRRRIAGVPAVAVAERDGHSAAVIVLDAEAGLSVLECASVRYSTLDVVSVAEAARTLREVVMGGLALIEGLDTHVPDAIRNLQWRDWQADMSRPAVRGELAALLRTPAHAPLLHTAIDIHHAMSPVLAPASLQPPELGAMLHRLHTAAASVVTAITRENGIG